MTSAPFDRLARLGHAASSFTVREYLPAKFCENHRPFRSKKESPDLLSAGFVAE
jgi:hypothetical protein